MNDLLLEGRNVATNAHHVGYREHGLQLENLGHDSRIAAHAIEERRNSRPSTLAEMPKKTDLFIQVDEPVIDDECYIGR